MLIGRESVCSQIHEILDQARRGFSSALVVRGAAGVGKTALCRYALDRAEGMVLLTAQGIETESDLPFAGLSELFRGRLKRIEEIPRAQATALADALALDPPAPPAGPEAGDGTRPTERFTVYAATLSLLAALAEEGPLLAVIDDAHWLDEPSAEALVFTARRLQAEGAVLLFAVRDGEPAPAFEGAGLPEVIVAGLDRTSSHALLSERTGHTIDEAVADQLFEATGGNPLALTEIPAIMSERQLTGAEPLDDPLPAGPTLERIFHRLILRLPPAAQRALLVLAAGGSADPSVLGGTIEALGGHVADLELAEDAGLIRMRGSRLEFRHPLLRSAVYHRASSVARRAVHRALAESLSTARQPDLCAWHLAAASTTPDEEVAQALEHAGYNARRRGGSAVAARALERAARLTPHGGRRAQRLVAAADDWQLAGQLETAAGLLEEALGSTDDPLLRADIHLLRGRMQTSQAPVMQAHDLLVGEAARIESLDSARAAMMLAEACLPAMAAGEVGKALSTAERAYELAKEAEGLPLIAAGLALGSTSILAGDPVAGHQLVVQWLPLLDLDDPLVVQQVLGGAGHCLIWVEDFEREAQLLDPVIANARAHGAVAGLPYALAIRSELQYRIGRWTLAYADATEALRLASETGQLNEHAYGLCCLAYIEAARGQEDDCRHHVSLACEQVESLQLGAIRVYAGCVLGLLELGLGQSARVIAQLEPVASFAQDAGLTEPSAVQWAPDLIEAYIRVGRVDDARDVLTRFQRQAELTGRSWALAASARCRGLLAGGGSEADAYFAEAIEWHMRTPTPFERARTELSWGECLRRNRRRSEARKQLRAALATFEQLGAVPWAERGRTELRAAGARPRQSTERFLVQELTPQELQVARIVAQGLTNPEAAAALFLSRKTIEFHLGNIYRKLGLRSRTELARLLAITPIPDDHGDD